MGRVTFLTWGILFCLVHDGHAGVTYTQHWLNVSVLLQRAATIEKSALDASTAALRQSLDADLPEQHSAAKISFTASTIAWDAVRTYVNQLSPYDIICVTREAVRAQKTQAVTSVSTSCSAYGNACILLTIFASKATTTSEFELPFQVIGCRSDLSYLRIAIMTWLTDLTGAGHSGGLAKYVRMNERRFVALLLDIGDDSKDRVEVRAYALSLSLRILIDEWQRVYHGYIRKHAPKIIAEEQVALMMEAVREKRLPLDETIWNDVAHNERELLRVVRRIHDVLRGARGPQDTTRDIGCGLMQLQRMPLPKDVLDEVVQTLRDFPELCHPR